MISIKAISILLIAPVAVLVSACAPLAPVVLHPAYADPGYHRYDTVYVQDPNYNHYNRRTDTTVNDVTVNRDTVNDRTVNRTDVSEVNVKEKQSTAGEQVRKPTHKSLAQQQEQGNQQGTQ